MLSSLLAAALIVVPNGPATIEPAVPSVPRVICYLKDGYVAGTAFRVGPKYLVTVNHVVAKGLCAVDGKAVKIVYQSAKLDFAILEEDGADDPVPVDCNGFIPGHKYIAIGHARGIEELLAVPMVAIEDTYTDAPNLSLLSSIVTAQPGQSGGPIIDAETGKVVGTVNTGDWEQGLTGSLALKNTSICGAAA